MANSSGSQVIATAIAMRRPSPNPPRRGIRPIACWAWYSASSEKREKFSASVVPVLDRS
jgi:hypothetical protein